VFTIWGWGLGFDFEACHQILFVLLSLMKIETMAYDHTIQVSSARH
jgi:hypothetical protein